MLEKLHYFYILVSRFLFSLYNYSSSNELSIYINNCINTGIISVAYSSRFDMYILFGNELIVEFWNENKYYAWLSKGSIISKESGELYKWKNKRPNRRTMARLYCEIEKYEKRKNK